MPRASILWDGSPGPDNTLAVGVGVTLTNDNVGDESTYSWALINKPAGSSAVLAVGAGPGEKILTPDVKGTYVVRLIVDGGLIDVGAGAALHAGSVRMPAVGESTEWDSTDGWAEALSLFYQASESAVHVDRAGEIDSAAQKVVPAAGDVLLIEDSTDSYNKKKILIGTLPTTASPAGILTVAPSGADYTSIQAAMNAAAAGQSILVYPGNYAEDLDFTSVADGVRVTGYPNALNVRVTGSSTSSTRVLLNQNGTIREITVVAPSTGSNPAIDCSGLAASKLAVIYNVAIQGGGGSATGPALLGAGSGIVAVLSGFYHNGGSLGGPLIECTSGTMMVQELIANIGSCTSILKQSGGTVEARDWLIQPSSLYICTDVFEISGGSLDMIGLQISRQNPACTNCLHITGSPLTVELHACQLFGATWDFLVDPGVSGAGSALTFSACDFRQERASATALWADNLESGLFNYADPGVDNDPTVRSGGQFSVGALSRPAPSWFGGGADIVQGLFVYAHDGVGGYTDHTAAAKSRSGSTFNPIPGVGVGNEAYFGCSFSQFAGLYYDVTAALVPTNNFEDCTWEYWNGSAWSEFQVMSRTNTGQAQYSSKVFERSTQEYVHFDTDTLYTDWATTTVNGQSAYWVRLRVSTAIVTAPTLERVKIMTNNTSMTETGFVTFSGAAEGIYLLPAHQKLFDDIQGNSPGNEPLDVSSNIHITPGDNSLQNNNDSGLGSFYALPIGLDTSRQLTVRAGWKPSSTGTGTVALRAYIASPIDVGDAINSGTVPEQEIINADTLRPSGSHQTDAPVEIDIASQDQLFVSEFKFRLFGMEPGSFFGLALRRMSSSVGDTYSGNVDLAFIEVVGKRWRM